WVPAAGGTIRWQVPGSTDAVEIAADFREEASVERSNSAGKWPTAEALFHLASREIGAGELVSITEDGEVVQVRSEYFELAKLDQESLSAVVFKPVQIKPRGFSDPGWRVLSEDPKLVTIQKTAAGKVTIKPGGSIGHAAFLQGNRIEFKLHDVERYSTLKVRLFCADPEDVGGSTDLVFFYYNDRIYIAQQIRGQRGVRNQQQVNISPGSAVPVSIEWDDKMTKATINGVVLEIPKNDEAPRGGRGVVFEPGDMWNNGLRAVAFSHLKLEREPGFTWSPPVSAEVKEKALFIPRFRAERPQRHALFAANGDVLRGTIETATASQIAFRSGLETMTIGRDRVAAAIWLKPAEEEADADDEPAAEPVEGEADADDEPAAEPETSDETGHWIILGNGARFHLTVDDFGPEFLAGRSDLLGKCQLPVDQIYAISPTTPNVDPASLAFADWRLKKAPFPRIPGNEGDSEGSMEGQDAPEFSLKNLDGNAIEFDEDAPKIVVLDFWATWCGPCHRSMPELIEAVAEFPKKDVRLIAVNQGEAAARIQEFLEAREWGDLEVALDQNQSVGTQFQVEGIPHVVVIGTDGKIALVETGYRPGGSEAVGNVIRQLLEVESQ
ncbi:MAG: thiol-disulfide isomerase/thioredoxin, partial [Verrucomicrobiales bacterium]